MSIFEIITIVLMTIDIVIQVIALIRKIRHEKTTVLLLQWF